MKQEQPSIVSEASMVTSDDSFIFELNGKKYFGQPIPDEQNTQIAPAYLPASSAYVQSIPSYQIMHPPSKHSRLMYTPSGAANPQDKAYLDKVMNHDVVHTPTAEANPQSKTLFDAVGDVLARHTEERVSNASQLSPQSLKRCQTGIRRRKKRSTQESESNEEVLSSKKSSLDMAYKAAVGISKALSSGKYNTNSIPHNRVSDTKSDLGKCVYIAADGSITMSPPEEDSDSNDDDAPVVYIEPNFTQTSQAFSHTNLPPPAYLNELPTIPMSSPGGYQPNMVNVSNHTSTSVPMFRTSDPPVQRPFTSHFVQQNTGNSTPPGGFLVHRHPPYNYVPHTATFVPQMLTHSTDPVVLGAQTTSTFQESTSIDPTHIIVSVPMSRGIDPLTTSTRQSNRIHLMPPNNPVSVPMRSPSSSVYDSPYRLSHPPTQGTIGPPMVLHAPRYFSPRPAFHTPVPVYAGPPHVSSVRHVLVERPVASCGAMGGLDSVCYRLPGCDVFQTESPTVTLTDEGSDTYEDIVQGYLAPEGITITHPSPPTTRTGEEGEVKTEIIMNVEFGESSSDDMSEA